MTWSTSSARERPPGSSAGPARRARVPASRTRCRRTAASPAGSALGASRRRRLADRRCRSPGRPARALNSSISASQTGRIERMAVQWRAGARASNSSSGHALLLHPREVAEVEDPVAVGPGQLEDVVRRPAPRTWRPNVSAAATPSKPSGKSRALDLVALGPVHRRAVRRDRDDDVVRSETEALGDLDRGEHVADARQAERAEVVDDRRRDAAPPDEVVAAGRRC